VLDGPLCIDVQTIALCNDVRDPSERLNMDHPEVCMSYQFPLSTDLGNPLLVASSILAHTIAAK